MNIQKLVALSATAATILVVGYHAAQAQGPDSCHGQPKMQGALNELREAKAALERAEHNKDGWRDKAIGHTNEAIGETERGCAAAK
jgi:hypothetical protein